MCFLADAAPSVDWVPQIFNLGASGFIIYWLCNRLENRLEKLTNAVNASTKAQLLQVMLHPRATEEMKGAAKAIGDESEGK